MGGNSVGYTSTIQIMTNRKTFGFAAKQAARAYDKGDLEDAAAWSSIAASIAWHSHPGFFISETLDKTLCRIGRDIKNQGKSVNASGRESPEIKNMNLLHVMTSAYPIGGHTRAVGRWIQNCRKRYPEQRHSLMITHQGSADLSDWLIGIVKDSGGECSLLPSGYSLVQSATELRAHSQHGFDLVVLHVHPDDPVPAMAFSIQDFNVPILLFNHADHLFSIVTSVADVILDFRQTGKRITETRRRGSGRSMLLPIPLVDQMSELGVISREKRKALREEARGRLRIDKDKTIALTVAATQKYKPALGSDFVRTASRILTSVEPAQIFAVGLLKDKELNSFSTDANPRFHALGIINDSQLRDYFLAADVFLEIFPFSSLTAMLEAGLYSLPIQRFRNKVAPILSGDDVSFDPLVPVAFSEEEYIEGATKLLLSRPEVQYEIGDKIRQSILADHCGAAWVDKWFEPAVKAALSRKHTRKVENMWMVKEQSPNEESILMAEWKRDLHPGVLLCSLGMRPSVSPRIKVTVLLYSLLRFEPLLRRFLSNPPKPSFNAYIEKTARASINDHEEN